MYKFDENEEKEIMANGLKILGQELRYSELCKNLGIKPVTGTKQKTSQLKDLSNLFDYDIVPCGRQVRYVIRRVYERPLLPSYDKDEWYVAIKTRICEMLRDNNYQAMWFTQTPLLKDLGAVNDNYGVVMSNNKREQLESLLGRGMDMDYEVCRIFGNILSERVYDALDKMAKKEKIIHYSDGYVIRYIKDGYYKYFEVPIVIEKDGELTISELSKILSHIETQAIDDAIRKYNPGFLESQPDLVNRDFYKYIYSSFVDNQIELALNEESVKEKLKEFGVDFDEVYGLYNVKFISPIKRLVDTELRWRGKSKQMINAASKNKLLSSKRKELIPYEAMKKGLVDICIDLTTNTNYSAMIKND